MNTTDEGSRAVTGTGLPVAATESGLTLEAEAAEGCLVLHSGGEIDVVTAPRLQDELEQLIARHPGSVLIVDLTRVSFLASAGLAVLTRSADLGAQTRLLVVACGPATLRPLELTGLTEVIEVYESVEAAMATV